MASDLKAILLDVTTKYKELVTLVQQLIATKVEDSEKIASLENEVTVQATQISDILASNEETAQIASELSNDISLLIETAKNASPATPIEEPVPTI